MRRRNTLYPLALHKDRDLLEDLGPAIVLTPRTKREEMKYGPRRYLELHWDRVPVRHFRRLLQIYQEELEDEAVSALLRASPTQLATLTREDLLPFFSHSDADVRLAAIRALSSVTA